MPTALIQFTQGANTDSAGKAVLGVYGDFSTVTVSNDDSTDVVSWKIYLLDAPSDSATFPAAGLPQILAQASNGDPTLEFTPDVAGTYRVMLEVRDVSDEIDRDIRCFGIPDARGFVRPPFQENPPPLPLLLPPIIADGPRPVKPDEQNYGENVRGWAGNGAVGQIDDFLRRYDDLPFVVVDDALFDATEDGPPLYIVDTDEIGAPSTFQLPMSPRTGIVVRVSALGAPDNGFPVTVSSIGTIGETSTFEIVGGSGGVFVHRGNDNWIHLEPAGGGGGGGGSVGPGVSSIKFVDANRAPESADAGTAEHPFGSLYDAVDALPVDGGTIIVGLGAYAGADLDTSGKTVFFEALQGSALPFVTLPNVVSSSPLGFRCLQVGDVTGSTFVFLDNVSTTGTLQGGIVHANAKPEPNNLATLNIVNAASAATIAGYSVLGTVTVTSGTATLRDAIVMGTVTATGVFARDTDFQNGISVTSGVSLQSCKVTGVIEFTLGPGTVVVDIATYKSMLASGATVSNGILRVTLPAGDELRAPGWAADAPVVLTVMSAGHAPGIYSIHGIAIIRATGTGNVGRRVDWSSPEYGADEVISASTAVTSTGSRFTTPVSIRSDGTSDITVTFSPSGIGDAPEIDIYAGATLQISA